MVKTLELRRRGAFHFSDSRFRPARADDDAVEPRVVCVCWSSSVLRALGYGPKVGRRGFFLLYFIVVLLSHSIVSTQQNRDPTGNSQPCPAMVSFSSRHLAFVVLTYLVPRALGFQMHMSSQRGSRSVRLDGWMID
jgi:hypothetical protein